MCHLQTKFCENHLSGFCIFLSLSQWTWVSWYQNVSILDSIGAKGDGDGGNNWSHWTCKAIVKTSPTTNIQQTMPFLLPNQQRQSTAAKNKQTNNKTPMKT